MRTSVTNDSDILVREVEWMFICPRCEGNGMVLDEEESYTEYDKENLDFEFHASWKKCPACDGKGHFSKPKEWFY